VLCHGFAAQGANHGPHCRADGGANRACCERARRCAGGNPAGRRSNANADRMRAGCSANRIAIGCGYFAFIVHLFLLLLAVVPALDAIIEGGAVELLHFRAKPL
jgi:hypothetical protein